MFALIGGKTKRVRVPDPSTVDLDGGLVLPRPLRRIVRLAVSLCTGRIAIPAHTGTIAVVGLFAATGYYGVSLGGHSQAVAQATTSAVGFAIEDVKVSGNAHTSEIDILQQLGLDGTTSLVALDIGEARRLIAELPWVERVTVRKVYPGTIEVDLTERKAFAIWQHGSDLSLIEESGSVIAPLRDNKFASLPLFVGRDAEAEAAKFYSTFSQWPEMKSRVKAFIRIAARRWDLQLDNGVLVRLPEHDLARAMERLATLEREHQILERDIATVDLRLGDRTTVQLTEGAVERREAVLKERTKRLKAEEKNI
ncbi:cell division protein FtsQ/DivIB [Ensifer soli]|uniref:cell division protein FtsQ/DivIB n=1 Tax=Ciceribacter sp. sgz301302 TaxID=3342379 RepID=UPI0035B82468